MKLCEILSATHTHAGRDCVKGDRIELDNAVAEHFAKMDPPVVKVIGAVPSPADAAKHPTTKKGS